MKKGIILQLFLISVLGEIKTQIDLCYSDLTVNFYNLVWEHSANNIEPDQIKIKIYDYYNYQNFTYYNGATNPVADNVLPSITSLARSSGLITHGEYRIEVTLTRFHPISSVYDKISIGHFRVYTPEYYALNQTKFCVNGTYDLSNHISNYLNDFAQYVPTTSQGGNILATDNYLDLPNTPAQIGTGGVTYEAPSPSLGNSCLLRMNQNVQFLDTIPISFLSTMPDTISSTQWYLDITPQHVNSSGSIIYPNGSNLTQNQITGNIGMYISSQPENTTQTIKLQAKKTHFGVGYCYSNITHDLYIKNVPTGGAYPNTPRIGSNNLNPNYYDLIGSKVFQKNYQHENGWYVCDGETLNFNLIGDLQEHIKWNMPNPFDNEEYVWILSINNTYDTISLNDTAISIIIPNNGLNDEMSLICKAKNSIGNYSGANIVKLQTVTKPNLNLLDSICISLRDTFVFPQNTSVMLEPNVFYPLGIFNDSLYDSTINYYQNGMKSDTVIRNFSGNKFISNEFTYKITHPYFGHKHNVTRTHDIQNSIYYYSYQNSRTCEYKDTLTAIQQPIPGVSTSNPSFWDSDLQGGYNMNIANTSSLYDSAYWWHNFTYQAYPTNNFNQWLYKHGYHNFHLFLKDRYGCMADTLIDSLIYIRNYQDSLFFSGINEVSQTNLNIYPNPFNNQINIELDKTAEFNIILFNNEGKIIKQEKANKRKNTLVLDERLPKGIYLLKIESDIETKTYKLIK